MRVIQATLLLIAACSHGHSARPPVTVSIDNVRGVLEGNNLYVFFDIEQNLDTAICFDTSALLSGGSFPKRVRPGQNHFEGFRGVDLMRVKEAGSYRLILPSVAQLQQYQIKVRGFKCSVFGRDDNPGERLIHDENFTEIYTISLRVEL